MQMYGFHHKIQVFDMKSKRVLQSLKGHYSQVNSVQFNASDTLVASVSNTGMLLIHEVNNPIPIYKMQS